MALFYSPYEYLHVEKKTHPKFRIRMFSLWDFEKAEIGLRTCYYLILPNLPTIFAPFLPYLNFIGSPCKKILVLFV